MITRCILRSRRERYSSGHWLVRLLMPTAFFLCGLCESGRALTLEVTGTLIGCKLRGDLVLMTSSNWFKATFNERVCNIKTGSFGRDEVIYHEYGVLEKDSYVLEEFNTNRTITEYVEMHGGVAKHFKLDKPVRPANEAMLFLSEGGVPESNLGLLTPVWLAYGFRSPAGRTSGTAKSRAIFPITVEFLQRGGQTDVEYAMKPSTPQFLSQLREVVSARDLTRFHLRSQFGGDLTNCTYQATGWTNVGGGPSRPAFIPSGISRTTHRALSIKRSWFSMAPRFRSRFVRRCQVSLCRKSQGWSNGESSTSGLSLNIRTPRRMASYGIGNG